MSLLDNLINQKLSIGDRKRERLEQAAEEKKKALDPSWNVLKQGNYDVLDGDTVRLRDTGQLVRFGSDKGTTVDTFESSPDIYEKYPDRKKMHKKALSEITGRPEWMITTDQLVDRGRVEKQRLQEYLDQATQNGGVEFQTQGLTADGRMLANFRNQQDGNAYFDQMRGRERNANYNSKYNALQRFDDLVKGKQDSVGKGTRSVGEFAQDQAVNLAAGGADMLNSLGQAASLVTGTNGPATDQFFGNNRDRIEHFKEKFASEKMLRRERKDATQAQFNQELYNVNYNKYKKQGNSDKMSRFLAGAEETGNSIRNIIQDPGKIVDKTVESLPYMFGVGAASSAVARTAVGILEKEVFAQLAFGQGGASIAGKMLADVGGRFTTEAAKATAKKQVAAYLASDAGKKAMNSIIAKTSITTVGLTEGFTNAADVYDSIMKMTEEEAMQSEKYQALRMDGDGMNHTDALRNMAEEAAGWTMAATIPMAMAAGKLSGAAEFEGKLFTNLGGKVLGKEAAAKAATTAAKEKVKNLERGAVTKAAIAVGKRVKPAFQAGAKETIEETIQSGGGEFLSQLAKFDATGKEVGSGVGTAAGEGGVVGFASGFGAGGASTALKSVGQGIRNFAKGSTKKYQEQRNNVKLQPAEIKAGGSVVPGGSVSSVNKITSTAGENYKPEVALFNQVKKIADQINNNQDADLSSFNEMKLHYENAQRKGVEIPEPVKNAYEDLNSLFETTIARRVSELSGKKEEEFTNADIGWVIEAGRLGVVKESDFENLPERAKTSFNQDEIIRGTIEQAEQAEDAAVADKVYKGSRAEIERVHFEKFGDTYNARGHRGMRAYYREMSEAIVNDDEKGYMELAGKLKNFLATQRRNIKDIREVIRNKKDSARYKYVEGSTEQLLQTMLKEGELFAKFRQHMGKQYVNWRPKAGSQIAATVTEDLNPGTDEGGTPTPSQGDTQAAGRPNLQPVNKPVQTSVEGGERPALKPVKQETQSKETPAGRPALKAVANQAIDQGTSQTGERPNLQPIQNDADIEGESSLTEQDAENPNAAEERAAREAVAGRPALTPVANRAVDTGTEGTRATVTPVNRATERPVASFEETLNKEKESANKQSVADLRKEAKDWDISGRSSMRKADLVEAIAQKRAEAFTRTNNQPASAPAQQTNTPTSAPARAEPAQLTQKLKTELTRQAFFDYSTLGVNAALVRGAIESVRRKYGKRAAKFYSGHYMAVMKRYGAQRAQKLNIARQSAKNAKTNGFFFFPDNTFVLDNNVKEEIDNGFLTEEDINNLVNNQKIVADTGVGELKKGDTVLLQVGDIRKWAKVTFANERTDSVGLAPLADPQFQTLRQGELGLETPSPKAPSTQPVQDTNNDPVVTAIRELSEARQQVKEGVADTEVLSEKVSNAQELLDEAKESLAAVKSLPASEENSISEDEFSSIIQALEEHINESEDTAQAQPEQVSEQAVKEQANIQERLEEAMDLRNIASKGKVSLFETVLSNEQDDNMLSRLLNSGMETNAALTQVINYLRDQRDENITLPKIELSEETLSTLETKVEALSKEKGFAVAPKPSDEDYADFADESYQETFKKWVGTVVSDNLRPVQLAINFAKIKMPIRLLDAFEQKSPKTASLIAAMPNLMEALSTLEGRNRFADAAKLSVKEARALFTFTKFYKEFARVLESSQRDIDQNNANGRGQYMHERIREGGMYYFMKDGKVNPQVVTAMALEAMNWLSTAGQRGMFNDDDAINGILGAESSHTPSPDQKRVLTYAGTVRSNVAIDVGNRIWKHLNLKFNNDPQYDNLMRDRIINSLGSTAITTMKLMGHVELSAVDAEWFKKNSFNDNETVVKGEPHVSFIRLAAQGTTGKARYGKSDANKNLEVAFREGKEMFENLFGSDANIRMPSFKEPKETDVPTHVDGSTATISDEMRKRMHYANTRVWRAKTGITRIIKRFGSVENYLKLAHGYVDDIGMKRVHNLDKKAVEGRNAGMKRDLEYALDWNERYLNTGFYLENKMISSGRIYINSNVVNPQANKIHRFMFAMDEWLEDIPTDESHPDFEQFLYAIGLGLGVKTDKLDKPTVLKQTRALLESDAIKEAIAILENESDEEFTSAEQEKLGKVIGKEGTHTLAALEAYANYKNARAVGASYFQNNFPMETDGTTNGSAAGYLQTPPPGALTRMRNVYNAVGVFFQDDTTMYRHYQDFIAAGNFDNYQDVAKDVSEALAAMPNIAPYTGQVRNNADKFAKRTIEIKRRAAEVYSSGLLPSLTELFDESTGQVSKTGRDWTKDPLMIAAYGASVNSIIENIIDIAEEKFRAKLAAVDTSADDAAQQIADVLNTAYKIVNVYKEANKTVGWGAPKIPPNGIYTADMVKSLAKKIPANEDVEYDNDLHKLTTNMVMSEERNQGYLSGVRGAFRDVLKATYGDALRTALDSKLRPVKEFRDYLNHASFLMNEIFVQDYVRRIDKREQAKRGNDNQDYLLSRDERREILQEMHNEGLVPSVATALSDKLSDNLEITEFYNKPLAGPRGRADAHLNQPYNLIDTLYEGARAELGTAAPIESIVTRITDKMPKNDVGVSGVVKLIHALDGVNNSAAWGSNPVLNIHDAQITSVLSSDRIGRIMNQDFIRMHSEYSLGTEIHNSLQRMLVLVADGDQRLSKEAKQIIFNNAKTEFMKRGLGDPDVVAEMPAREVVERYNRRLKALNDRNNAERQDLFSKIRMSHQFAKDGTQVIIDPDNLNVNARTQPYDGGDRTLNQVADDYRQTIQGINAARIRNTAAKLVGAFTHPEGRFGSPNKLLTDYIRNDQPTTKEVMEVLVRAFDELKLPQAEAFRRLFQAIQPHLRDRTRIEIGQPGTDTRGVTGIASFDPATDTATILDNSASTVTSKTAASLVHEITHSATVFKLKELEQNNPEAFKRLKDKVTAFSTANLSSNDAVVQYVAELIKTFNNKKDYMRSISEYLSYTFSEYKSENGTYQLLFPEVANSKEMLQVLFESLQNKDGTNQLYSMGQPTNRELFENKYANKLEADKMQQVVDDILAIETPTDMGHANYLKSLVDTVVVPGLKSIEPLYQAMETNLNSSTNLGEIEGDVIRLEAAGNKLTNAAQMSLLETAVHEYVHAITKAAIDGDYATRAEVRRLFEIAQKEITWEDLMPEATEMVGDPATAEQIARDRYDYIFNNGETGYHEFMAIGLTNKQFAKALSRISNEATAEPIFTNGILQSMLNLFTRMFQWIGKHSLQTRGGTVHSALYRLSKNIIANNQRNMQRIADAQSDKVSSLDNINHAVADSFAKKITEPVTKMLINRAGSVRDGKPTIGKVISSLTASVVRSKDAEVRKAYNEVYRAMGGTKDNFLFAFMQEFMPWDSQNLGTVDENGNTQKLGWIDLFRNSRVMVDMTRQNMIEHTASFLNGSFDPNRQLIKEDRLAMTNVVLKTDLSSLMESMSDAEIVNMLNNPSVVNNEILKRYTELKTELENQGQGKYLNVFENQMNSLSNIMIHGVATVENPMLNAHNIVKRFNLGKPSDHVELANEAKLVQLVDEITSLKALNRVANNDIARVRDIANHELQRGPNNGFSTLLGMSTNFRMLSEEHLFKEKPVLMRKGYVYEMMDGDINVEYVYDTPAERARMAKEGMYLVGELPKDDLDPNRGRKLMYRGLKGLATYNHGIVSLTDRHRAGTNLYKNADRDLPTAHRHLQRIRAGAFQKAEKQFIAGHQGRGHQMVPVLDENGNIMDYRYIMSEANKISVMKKEDMFDAVLARMFASIPDRVNTTKVNDQVVELLYDEYDKLKDSREHRFLEISKRSKNTEAREMYALLPEDMRRSIKKKFGSDTFYIRDDVVRMVLGTRKISVANTKIFGEYTPIARQAEKIWQETVQHIRVNIAIRTPAVVIGNVASNTAMLLSEGISPKYIRDKGAEAMAAMGRYQKDVRIRDELAHRVGADKARGQVSKVDISRLARLNADIASNPVHKLVQEGLFTSIAEDLGATDISLGRKGMNRLTEKARQAGVPDIAVSGVKELYMLPGSKSFKAAMVATQYGDFVARYVKFKHDTEVKKMPELQAIHEALAAFIYYDIPQHEFLQFMNDNGLYMFTKFFLRIQPIIAKMYSQNPATAFTVLALQKSLLFDPIDENIGEKFGIGAALHKMSSVGPQLDRIDIADPALLQWVLSPFGL